MQYVIDRLEEELALCENENKETLSIPRTELPDSIKEGDVLVLLEGIWIPDPDKTQERRAAIRKKMIDLFE